MWWLQTFIVHNGKKINYCDSVLLLLFTLDNMVCWFAVYDYIWKYSGWWFKLEKRYSRLLQELICILQEEIENICSILFFNYLPSSSSSFLNGTLLIILKLKLRWDYACTEDVRDYFFSCDDTANIILEWTLFQLIVPALISSWPDRFSTAKLKFTIKTSWVP